MDFISISLQKVSFFFPQIVNRNVAEPSVCKHSINFLCCLGALLADLQKRWNTPEIEVPTVAYPTLFCHTSPRTGSFNCKTDFIIELPVLLCLLCLAKISEICVFCSKHDFLPPPPPPQKKKKKKKKKENRLKRCTLSCEFCTGIRFELRALV